MGAQRAGRLPVPAARPRFPAAWRARWLGADRVIWASDYPHPEFHPGVVKELQEAIAPLSDDERRAIVGGNAIAAYNLPL